jgi:hypothetical protein
VLGRVQAGGDSIGRANLRVDVPDVVPNRFRCDVEVLRDLLARQPARQHPEHFDFTRRQPSRLLGSLCGAMAGGAEDGFDGIPVEASAPDLVAQFVRRVTRRPRFAVGPRFEHRLVDVGCRENLGGGG